GGGRGGRRARWARGPAGDAALAGLDPRHRALLVLERGKAGLVFDPDCPPADLLAEAAGEARVTHPATATVYSLDALGTTAPVRVTTAPRPVRGPAVRPPAVAGTF